MSVESVPLPEWPSYSELQARVDAPPGSSWGVFGDKAALGTLNFIGEAEVQNAASLIRHGTVFNLDYELTAFSPYPSGTRKPLRHEMFSSNDHHRDDWLDSFYLQATSQIDGLRHIGHPKHGFYEGVNGDELVPGTDALGIHAWAEHGGIVGRGVLLDVGRQLASDGTPLDSTGNYGITVADLERTIAKQEVALHEGDILLIRTGWAADYLRRAAQHAVTPGKTAFTAPGLIQSTEMVEFLWDHRVSLLAADNPGVECFPVDPSSPFSTATSGSVTGIDHNGMLHRPLIAMLGMALGELWALDDLAEDCARDGVFDFFLSAKPLNLKGGVGSPANAIAIK